MLAAEPVDLGPVVRLGRDHAAGADNRLADEGGDLPGPLVEQRAQRLHVHRPDVHHLVDERAAVARLHRPDADERRAPAMHPVVAELPRDDEPLLRATHHVPVAPGELRSGIDGVRPTRAQEDHGVRERRQGGEALRQLDGGLRGVRPERLVGRQPEELIGHRVRDRSPAVADVAEPEARDRIDVPAPGGVLQPDAFAGADHDLVVGDRVHVGEPVPERRGHQRSYEVRQDSIESPIASPYSFMSNSQFSRRVSCTIF